MEPEPGETVYIWEPRSFPSVDKALEDLANKYPEYREGLHPNNSPGTVRCVCGNPRRNDANTSFTCVEYGPPDERGASHGSCRHVATKKWVEQQKGLEVRNGDATGVDPDRHLTLCG